MVACVGAIVGPLPTIRGNVSMFPHLNGFMFAYERLVSGYWWHCCLAHGHQPRPPGDMQSLAYLRGVLLADSAHCFTLLNAETPVLPAGLLWRCSILLGPGEDDLRFLVRALHINRDPDLISTKVGENWPIILTFVKIRPPFVRKIFHFWWTSLNVEFAR